MEETEPKFSKEGEATAAASAAETTTANNPSGGCVLDVVAEHYVELIYGRDPRGRNSKGQTPLVEASASGDETGVFMVLHHLQTHYTREERILEINRKGHKGWSALHESIQYPVICKLLVDYGASLNSRDNLGFTALHFAIEEEADDSVTLLLIARGAQVDCTDYRLGQTPLALAAIHGNLTVAKELIEAGAMVDRPSSLYRRTPLHLAAEKGHKDLVQLFIDRGADVNVKDDDLGYTPLHLVASKEVNAESVLSGLDEPFIETAHALIEAGADVDAQTDADLDTPLHVAARAGNQFMVKILVMSSANTTLRNMHDKLALEEWEGDEDLVWWVKDAFTD